MHWKLNCTLYIIFFNFFTCIIATQFELYNSLDFPLFYALYDHTTKNHGIALKKLQAHSTVTCDVKSLSNIELVALKEIPAPDQMVPVTLFNLGSSMTNIYVKTHQTSRGQLRIIPQSVIPDQPAITYGHLELKNNIHYHDIWISSISYKPYIPEPPLTLQPTASTIEHPETVLQKTETLAYEQKETSSKNIVIPPTQSDQIASTSTEHTACIQVTNTSA